MKCGYRILAFFSLTALAVVMHSCRKPFEPPAISAPNSYLVIEGTVNSGSDSTFIKLSRTVKLSARTTVNPERNAAVSIEGDQNTSYPLTEIRPGIYASAGLNLDHSHKYRLSVQTSGGKQYVSDYVTVIDSPPIDSVHFDSKGDQVMGPGMNVYVSAHDPTGKVQYFRWDYVETWEFTSFAQSFYYSNGDTVLPRTNDIYHCYRSDTSSSILLGNTARLTRSVIINQPVNFVDYQSEKVSYEYSILVRQYALSSDAYNFYSVLRKITEQLGSIFDAQPSELQGNIHCITNPQEPVVGYFCVGNVTSQRIFVKKDQLPFWRAVTFYTQDNCGALMSDPGDPNAPCCLYTFYDHVGYKHNQVNEYINYNIGHDPYYLIPINAIVDPNTRAIVGYTADEPECVDCTLRGSNVSPAFWK
ncbi:MAG: DUF4249 domain-containing protein [Bacteroidetes bacterium]|nr:DUF4249 domain-containing protein [Bacteroidota bacterium]